MQQQTNKIDAKSLVTLGIVNLKLANKTSLKWLNRIVDTSTPWTEKEIIYFRKYLNGGCNCKDTIRELLTAFHAYMPKGGYDITIEQSLKGYNYLKSKTYTKKGTLRTAKDKPDFGHHELRVLNDFSHHKFTGLYDSGTGFYSAYVPLYTMYSFDNGAFEYTGVASYMMEVF